MTATQTEDFLDTLYGDIVGRVSVWWRTAPGSKSPYDKQAWFTWPEEKSQMVDFIEGVSDKDVCVTTTTYKMDRRVPEHVEQTHAVWMDSDVCNGDKYLVPPTWTVSTSGGRWQHFWALDQPIDALRASELVHRISIAHDHDGADQSSWPSNKIMRVPGTMNTSHGFPTRVKAETNGSVFSVEELEASYKHVVIPNRSVVRDLPDLHEEDLPAYSNVLAKLNNDLIDLVTSEPKPDQDRSRLRYKLLLELFRAGLSFEEVLAVAWKSPASRKWTEEDGRGMAGLIAEAAKAQAEAGTPRSEPSEPWGDDVDDEVELAIDKPVTLLTDEERELIRNTPSFIDKYVAYARKRLSHDNDSYDRIAAWTILSLAYMDTGYIPNGNKLHGKGKLNFYACTIGETTTGKTSSFNLMKGILRELFADDPEFNIGGNASETAIVKAMHTRDGRPSLFNSDEASGVLKTWVGQDWSAGMQERITELFDGEVAPLLRSAKGESVMKSTPSYLDVYLAGTQKGVMQYMTEPLFESGFIPRFIFAIGKPPRVDDSMFDLGRSEYQTEGFDPAARQTATVLKSNRQYLREYNGGEAPITISREANDRFMQAGTALRTEYKSHPMWNLILPSLLRWKDNVDKAAALIAMDNRRMEVTLTDMLHALEAGEEWLTNMLRIISRLNANEHERACNEIYQYVNSRGGRVGGTALYRKFSQYDDWKMANYLKSLQNQHRVWKGDKKEGNRDYYYSDSYEEGK